MFRPGTLIAVTPAIDQQSALIAVVSNFLSMSTKTSEAEALASEVGIELPQIALLRLLPLAREATLALALAHVAHRFI